MRLAGRVSFLLLLCLLVSMLLGGCEFFMTPQERSGINPKPFNYQSNWERSPYQVVN